MNSLHYTHFKDPLKVYTVLGLVRSAHHGGQMVMYRELTNPHGDTWVRDIDEFYGDVDRHDHQGPRFTPLRHLPYVEVSPHVSFPC